MEQALRYELVQAIPELEGEIYPTNAPETKNNPYLVYYRSASERGKTLDGYGNKQSCTYMISVMAKRYEKMSELRGLVEQILLDFPGRGIGENGDIHIEDITIEDINETYEFNLSLNRGVIVFTVYY